MILDQITRAKSENPEIGFDGRGNRRLFLRRRRGGLLLLQSSAQIAGKLTDDLRRRCLNHADAAAILGDRA